MLLKLKFEVQEKEIELTLAEAKQLYDDLHAVFGQKNAYPNLPQPLFNPAFGPIKRGDIKYGYEPYKVTCMDYSVTSGTADTITLSNISR